MLLLVKKPSNQEKFTAGAISRKSKLGIFGYGDDI
jgi:hypothetical protein